MRLRRIMQLMNRHSSPLHYSGRSYLTQCSLLNPLILHLILSKPQTPSLLLQSHLSHNKFNEEELSLLVPSLPLNPQPFFPEPLAQPLRGSVDAYGDELEYQRRLSSGYPYPSSSFPQTPSPPSPPSLPSMPPSASSSQPRLSMERYRQQLTNNQHAPKKNTAIPSRREENINITVSPPNLLPEMERSRQDSGWINRVDNQWSDGRVSPPLPIDEKTSALAMADLITLLGCRDRDPSTCSRITTDACLSRPGYYLKLCPVKCRNCSGLSCFDSVKVDCEEVLLLGGCRLPSAHEYCPRTCNLCPTTKQQPAMTEPLICSDQLETCSHLAQAGVCISSL
ncbi:hypothetical protein PENTCL1PPCAC_17473 [Pristionchus entomophagus]|uniref:ShKT domain-containing protein n=1 Tax=Pristionchus entomophagus TaxID=358040 RepID=A0AAV5TM64_9BILA|nr:hypothetical protein PENTCL1PPCAC_17473 [Pristionchus entomophagus]